MINHFEKLGTPLKSLSKYSTLEAQKKRFLKAGWRTARPWNLWQAWADERFFSTALRSRLDDTEPFDEWEELQLFATHYCLLHASTALTPACEIIEGGGSDAALSRTTVNMTHREYQHKLGRRRFGAPLLTRDVLGQPLLANVLGVGPQGRLPSYDIYRQGGQSQALTELSLIAAGPGARTCHTITDLGDAGCLLAGGRLSPANALGDSWVFQKGAGRWSRSHDLPLPLYRQAITRLGSSSLAFLAGGKSSPHAIFDGFLVKHPQHGWISCSVVGSLHPIPVFGAVLSCLGSEAANASRFIGILAGGIGSGGLVASQVLRWRLDVSRVEVCHHFCPRQGAGRLTK